MKYVKIWGGLGNQLFQFAFACHLNDKTNEDIQLLDVYGSPYPAHGVLNKLFEKSYIERMVTGSRNSFSWYFGICNRLYRKVFQVMPTVSASILVENLLVPSIESLYTYKLYDGYWQDLLFPSSVKNQLLSSLKSHVYLDHKYQADLSLIHSNHCPISVHVRRGDYAFSRSHILMDINYFKRCIEICRQKFLNPQFFIFSDNKHWVKEQLKNESDCIFIDHSTSSDGDLFEFLLMKSCRHHIIANSTFSWWAAWLNQYEEKTVMVPANWFTHDNQRVQKIIPKEWIVL